MKRMSFAEFVRSNRKSYRYGWISRGRYRDEYVRLPDGTCRYYLHGHLIAEYRGGVLRIRDAGWRTQLTQSRLNSVLASFGLSLRIGRKDGFWMLTDYEGGAAYAWTGEALVNVRDGSVEMVGSGEEIETMVRAYRACTRYLSKIVNERPADAVEPLKRFIRETDVPEWHMHGMPVVVYFDSSFSPGADYFRCLARTQLRRALLERPPEIARAVLESFIDCVVAPLEAKRKENRCDAARAGNCGTECPHFGTDRCRGTRRLKRFARLLQSLSCISDGCPDVAVCREYRIRGSVVRVGLTRVRGRRGCFLIHCMCVDGRRTVFPKPVPFYAVLPRKKR